MRFFFTAQVQFSNISIVEDLATSQSWNSVSLCSTSCQSLPSCMNLITAEFYFHFWSQWPCWLRPPQNMDHGFECHL